MNQLSVNKRNQYIRKLVSNARAIVTGQIDFPDGSLKMEKILLWINSIQPITETSFDIFVEFNKKTIPFAIGQERLAWHKDSLIGKDKELNNLVFIYREKLLEKCSEIIKIFGEKQY
ncbi:MAG: hypothetical protein ABUT20_41680 [Bacteroidota bacterium]